MGSGRVQILLLLLFTAGGLALQQYYFSRDGRPLTYDDAWHFENSLNLYHRLAREGPLEFARAYAGAFGIKPPLIAVLPLPFYAVFGTSLRSALLVNSLFLALVNVYLFALARRWYSATTGLLAVAIFQTMPLAMGLSRAFLTEYGLAALVIAFMYYLEASDHFARGLPNVMLGVLGGLGLLMKITFAAVAFPVLVTLVYRWKRERSARETVRPLLMIAVIAALIAGTWYAFNLEKVIGFSWRTSYGQIGRHYEAASRWIWLRDAGIYGISSYYTLAVLTCAGIATWRRRQSIWNERSWLLLSWSAPLASAAWLAMQQDLRHVFVALPPLAIWLAARVARAASTATAAAFLVIPMLGYGVLTFPLPVPANRLPFLSRDLGLARAPDHEGDWGQRRIVQAVREMAPDAWRPCYVVVAVEHPYFNANLLGYLNALDDGPFRFTSLGFDPDTPPAEALEHALRRIDQLDARFLILAEGFRREELQEFLNRLNEEIRGRLERGDLPFRRRAEVALTNGVRAVVYEREKAS